jgi:hypothetical protein
VILDRSRRAKWWICFIAFTLLGVVGGYDEAYRQELEKYGGDTSRPRAVRRCPEAFWPCILGGATLGLSLGFFAAHLLQRARPWVFLVVLVLTWSVLAAGVERAAAALSFVLFALAFVWFLAASGEEIPQ